MPLNVAVQMDHISRLHIKGDSTFALMLEAERRGHTLCHYTPDRLSLREGRVEARVEPVKVSDEEGRHFTLGDPALVDLSTFDVVLLRQDPPFDMGYITTTHILERIHPKTLVVNDPAHVRNAPEKLFVTEFTELTPPTLISRDRREIIAFREAHQRHHRQAALRQWRRRRLPDRRRRREPRRPPRNLRGRLPRALRHPALSARGRKGDKRIILVEGEPAGIINRVPAAGEARSNMHVGGRPEPIEMTARDREICAAIGPTLRERGLIFVGIDVIGDYLTEINVTSPTGIREVKRFGGADIAALVWDAIEARWGKRVRD